MHYRLCRHALPPAPAVLTSCSTFPLQCQAVEDVCRWHQHLPFLGVFLRLMIPSSVSSIGVGGLLRVAKETRLFIPRNHDIIKPLFRNMMSLFCILIGCQATVMPPSGGFPLFSRAFQCIKVRCLPDSFEIGRFFTSWANVNTNASAWLGHLPQTKTSKPRS